MSNGEPSTNDTAHRRDWETQRERLSAYLDGQLAPSERAALERHLPSCARCAAELAELRRTVALLRAMPAPVLPRSFALPATAAQHAPQAAPDSAASSPAAAASRREPAPLRTTLTPRRPAPWAGFAQWAGGLAAVAGLFVLFSGAFAGLSYGFRAGGASTAAAPTNLGPMHTPYGVGAAATPTITPPASATQDSANQALTPGSKTATPPTPSVAATPRPTPSYTGIHSPAATNGPAIPIVPLTGGGLLLGGGLIFIAASVARRRAA